MCLGLLQKHPLCKADNTRVTFTTDLRAVIEMMYNELFPIAVSIF